MIRKLLKVWMLAFTGTVLVAALSYAEPSIAIRTEAAPREIYIGDPVAYRIMITVSSDVMVAPLLPPVTLGDFELVQASSPTIQLEKDGKSTTIYDFVWMTFSTGSLTIQSLPLQFAAADGGFTESKTEEVSIKVKSLLEEKGDEGNIRPLKGLFNFKSYLWVWILLGVLAIVGLGFFFWRWRKGHLPGVALGPVRPPRPPEEVAWEAIHELEDADLIASGQARDFYYRLSTILRTYLVGRFGISALDRTTSELMAEFRRQNFQLLLTGMCRDFFENADLVKFAKFTPTTEDVTNDLNKVKQFINLTIPLKEQEKPKESIPV